MSKEVHIGHLAQQKLQASHHTAEWLAEQLHYHPRTIYKIFGKSDVNTKLLKRIGDAIGYNFFNI